MVINNQIITETEFRQIAKAGFGKHPIADLCSLALCYKHVTFLGGGFYFIHVDCPYKLNGFPSKFVLKAFISKEYNLACFESPSRSSRFNQLEAFNKMIELEILTP